MTVNTEREIISKWKNVASNPVVSICCITYNHENYIAQALDSMLAQEGEYSYEILIGEDCSTDQTRQILMDYQKKFPTIIKLLLHDENVGMMKNFIGTLQSCSGKYIAILEGDDYWTNPFKLQKQIDFLEKNLDFTISCHNSSNYNEEENCVIHEFPGITSDKEFTLLDLFNTNIANTCTTVYRNINLQIPEFFSTLKLGDWPLHMLYAEHGKIKYFHHNMATYRIHQGGVWSMIGREKILDNSIETLEAMDKYFNKKYHLQIYHTIGNYMFEKANISLANNNVQQANEYLNKAISYGIFIKLRKKIKFKIKCLYLTIKNYFIYKSSKL